MLRIARHLEEGLSAALLLFGLAIVMLEIVGRGVFGVSYLWSEEMSRYSLIWLTYFGAAAAVRTNSHIRITALTAILPKGAQRWLELMICALALIFTTYVAFYGLRYVEGTAMLGLMSSDSNIPIPIWVFHAIIPVGFGLMSLRLIERMIHIVRHPDADVLAEEA